MSWVLQQLVVFQSALLRQLLCACCNSKFPRSFCLFGSRRFSPRWTHPEDADQHGAAYALAHAQRDEQEAAQTEPQRCRLHAAAHCKESIILFDMGASARRPQKACDSAETCLGSASETNRAMRQTDAPAVRAASHQWNSRKTLNPKICRRTAAGRGGGGAEVWYCGAGGGGGGGIAHLHDRRDIVSNQAGQAAMPR